MLLTLFGIVIRVKAVHPLKEPLPKVVMFFGRETDVRLVQPANATRSMLITLLCLVFHQKTGDMFLWVL